MEEKIIVGLDIGTTKIAALVGKRDENGKLKIIGHTKTVSSGVQRGSVVNIERTTDGIKRVMEEVSNICNADLQYLNVGIAGHHIKSMKAKGMLTKDNPDELISQVHINKMVEDMYKIQVPSAGDKIIHAFPQHFNVDYEFNIDNPIGMAGSRIEANFHIITASLAAIKNIKTCVQNGGYNIVDIILEPMASAEAVLSNAEKEAGVVLVDIGGGTTDVAIFYDGVIQHTAVITLAGNAVTNDIAEGFRIDKKQAEKIKVEFGSAIPSEGLNKTNISIASFRGEHTRHSSAFNLAQIIHARMEQIVEMVQFQIKSSGLENKIGAGIVLTGGGSLLNNLPQLFEYITGISTRIGTPNENLSAQTDKVLQSPIYATGVGLVMQGLTVAESKQTNQNTPKVKKDEKVAGFKFFDALKGKFNFTDLNNISDEEYIK
jgi:cell division protein FtsA